MLAKTILAVWWGRDSANLPTLGYTDQSAIGLKFATVAGFRLRLVRFWLQLQVSGLAGLNAATVTGFWPPTRGLLRVGGRKPVTVAGFRPARPETCNCRQSPTSRGRNPATVANLSPIAGRIAGKQQGCSAMLFYRKSPY